MVPDTMAHFRSTQNSAPSALTSLTNSWGRRAVQGVRQQRERVRERESGERERACAGGGFSLGRNVIPGGPRSGYFWFLVDALFLLKASQKETALLL